MELNEIIEEIKVKYNGHENLDEVISDLTANSYFDYWGEKLCEDNFDNNTKLAKELFIIYEKENCQSSNDYCSLASKVIDGIKDKDWAKELFLKAYKKVEDNNDLLSVARDVISNLEDKEWGKTILQEVQNKIDNLQDFNSLIDILKYDLEDLEWTKQITTKVVDDFFESDDRVEFASYSSEIVELAQFVADKDICDDQEKAKKLYSNILIYEDINDLLDALREVNDIINDEEYCTNFKNDIIERAIELIEDGYYCDIYKFIKDELEDEDKAQEFKSNYEDEIKSDVNNGYGDCEDEFPVEIDTNTTGYFKIDICAYGGEFAYGIVENEKSLAILNEAIENNNLALNIYSNDGELMFYECDDQLLQCYGPDVNGSTISITVYEDEDLEDEIEEVVSSKSTDSIGVNLFTYENPWYSNEDKEKFSSDALQYGGFYGEKRIHFPAVVHIDEGGKFDITNVYVGTVNMDETLSGNEIVSIVLYITKEKEKEILDIYFDDEENNEPLSDYLSEIYYDIQKGNYPDIKALLRECECEVLDIEGKGESEEVYVVVKNLEDEVLCEGDAYSS